MVGNLAAGNYYLYYWGGEDRPFTITLNSGVDPIAAVPLPAALPLFASGLGVMAWIARRRKRTNPHHVRQTRSELQNDEARRTSEQHR